VTGTAGTPQLLLGGGVILPSTFTYQTSGNTAFVNLAGANRIEGTINLTSGGGDLVFDKLSSDGGLLIAADVTTVGTGGGTQSLRLRGASLSGAITDGSSPVGVVQEGGISQITGNANTYTGPTNVTSGILMVSNTSGSATGRSTVTVSGRGHVSGSGFITGNVIVDAGGEISVRPPDLFVNETSPRALDVGNLTFAGGLLVLSLDKTSNYPGNDYLNVTGTVNLTADSLLVVGIDFTPAPGQSFILLNNDGS
jgi:autotransporter-associated beta strand protein